MILFNSYKTTFAWLSNFYEYPVTVRLRCGTFEFRNAEAAYQCLKQHHLDRDKVIRFTKLSGRNARNAGKTLVDIHPDWDAKKEAAMKYVLRSKFIAPVMQKKLVQTGDLPLVHLSPWDRYWGVDDNGVGSNRLGELLMQIRRELS
jgi:N-glycosidase YbiA